MPELPEVETTRRGIAPVVTGRRIVEVLFRVPRLRWPLRRELLEVLPGQKVLAVERRAKYLLFQLTEGHLLVHLGMTGHLHFADLESPPDRHDHVELRFDRGVSLRFNDSRRFGGLLYTQGDPLEHQLLKSLGPEPFSASFDGDYLHRRSRGRRLAVKPFLMDQRVVVGVGNIYASEALFRSGIRPGRPAGEVSRRSWERLAGAVREVLEEAIAAGGTTLRDFTDGHKRPGYFKQQLRVYGREGCPCPDCGRGVVKVRLGQRSSFYCPGCQR